MIKLADIQGLSETAVDEARTLEQQRMAAESRVAEIRGHAGRDGRSFNDQRQAWKNANQELQEVCKRIVAWCDAIGLEPAGVANARQEAGKMAAEISDRLKPADFQGRGKARPRIDPWRAKGNEQ